MSTVANENGAESDGHRVVADGGKQSNETSEVVEDSVTLGLAEGETPEGEGRQQHSCKDDVEDLVTVAGSDFQAMLGLGQVRSC